ncbi:MAG TPA: hypothetical protein VI757_01215 [Bacteroidia bacterium]|nr:hypothetical protein [Bacteroidia bacterium]
MAKYFKDLGITAFYNFFETLQNKVSANQASWKIPPGEANDLAAAFNTYKPLNLAIRNKKTRTSQQVDDHVKGRTVAENLIQRIANEYIVSNSAISFSEKKVLGFNARTGERHERPRIEDTPFATMDAQPGSRIGFTCRRQSDASRPSIHPDADAVEVRCMVGNTAPSTVNDCVQKEISTRSKFVIELSPSQAGQKIFAFVRWRNNIHASKCGPFGDMLTTVVRS